MSIKWFFFNRINQVVTAPKCIKVEDSDDDKVPLSSKFPMKSTAGTSGNKTNNISEKKPLASKIQQNGSISKDKQQKALLVPTKRPMDKAISSDLSSAKKPKLSDAPTITKVKQVTVKADQNEEDPDDVPIAQRKKNLSSSGNKLLSAKQKATKVVSSSFKKTIKKNKKQMKNTKKFKK